MYRTHGRLGYAAIPAVGAPGGASAIGSLFQQEADMYPFEQQMMFGDVGATVPIPMAAMQGLGKAPIEPVIDGVSGPMHIALGAALGLLGGYLLWGR